MAPTATKASTSSHNDNPIGVFASYPTMQVFVGSPSPRGCSEASTVFTLDDGQHIQPSQVIRFSESTSKPVPSQPLLRRNGGKYSIKGRLVLADRGVYPLMKPQAPVVRPTTRELATTRVMVHQLRKRNGARVSARQAFKAVVLFCRELDHGLQYSSTLWRLDDYVAAYPHYITFLKRHRLENSPSFSAFVNSYTIDETLRDYGPSRLIAMHRKGPIFNINDVLCDHTSLRDNASGHLSASTVLSQARGTTLERYAHQERTANAGAGRLIAAWETRTEGTAMAMALDTAGLCGTREPYVIPSVESGL